MKYDDEPVLKFRKSKGTRSRKKAAPLKQKILRLMSGEKFAILSTQGSAQPYASIIGFNFSHDLKSLCFATPVTTRKYRLLKRCPQVALQIDNRSTCRNKLMNIESVTATGRSFELKRNSKFCIQLRALLKRHPYFKSFYSSPTCALFEVRVVRYFHVTRFQVVSQWIP